MAFLKGHTSKDNQERQGSTFNLSHDYWHNLSNIRIFCDFKVLLHSLKLSFAP